MSDSTQRTERHETTATTSALPANKQATRALWWAIASLFFALSVPIPVWGLFMLFLAVPLAIIALIVGYSGLNVSRTNGTARGMALTALGLAYGSLAICFFTTLFWVITMAVPRS